MKFSIKPGLNKEQALSRCIASANDSRVRTFAYNAKTGKCTGKQSDDYQITVKRPDEKPEVYDMPFVTGKGK